jgi:hypothetical protein
MRQRNGFSGKSILLVAATVGLSTATILGCRAGARITTESVMLEPTPLEVHESVPDVREGQTVLPDSAPTPAQTGGLIHKPSDTPEPVVQRRKDAWALAQNAPELADESIIPTLIDYIQDADAEVKYAGETAITRIGMSGDAITSGLRIAVKSNGVLTSTLFANTAFEVLNPLSHMVRAQAVSAISALYLDAPNVAIEELAIARYEVEAMIEVRRAIVDLVCAHGYSSEAVIALLTAAAEAFDPVLAQMASRCLNMLP